METNSIMKKILLFALPLMAMCAISCEKEEEWTDDSPIIRFKDQRFLEALLAVDYSDYDGIEHPSIDRNADGQISEKEASVVSYIRNVFTNIRNMDEIRYFTSLTELSCSYNQFTSLDLSNNTALTDLMCDYSQLTSLDVSNNTALTTLYCRYNQLTSLDVSNNTALTELSCDNNQLTSLDVSNNTALTELSCDNNQLTSLDVSINTALTRLQCNNNPLQKLILYKYHMIDEYYINMIESEYGNIIEYVE